MDVCPCDPLDDGGLAEGRPIGVFLACSDERSFVARTVYSDEGDVFWVVRFVSNINSHAVGLRFKSEDGSTKWNPDSLSLNSLVRESKEVDDSIDSRRDALEIAAFSDMPFAIFLSSTFLGVAISDIEEMLGSKGNEVEIEKSFECGSLRIDRSRSERAEPPTWTVREIRFDQDASDRLTMWIEGRRLSSYKNDSFRDGLASASYVTSFKPPLDLRADKVFVAVASSEKLGRDGFAARSHHRIICEQYSTDADEVNFAIERLITKIPNGVQAQTPGAIEYMWHDEKIVRRYDSEALAKARQLGLFSQNPALRYLFILLNLLIVVGIATFFIRKQKTGA